MSNPSRSATHTLPFETAFMLVLILIALGLHPAPVAYAQKPDAADTGERDDGRTAGARRMVSGRA